MEAYEKKLPQRIRGITVNGGVVQAKT